MSDKEILDTIRGIVNEMSDKEILDKIRGILESDKMTDDVKIANIHCIFIERFKYDMKPWYIR